MPEPADDCFNLHDQAVLVLSPHLDDAWLSASAILSSTTCDVWTVFAGTPDPAQQTTWDSESGFPDSTATMTARLAEDEAAFAGTVHRVRRLPLLDGAYAPPARRRADLPILTAALSQWLGANPAGVLVIPVGAGVHVKPALWEKVRDGRRQPAPVDSEAVAHTNETGSGSSASGIRTRLTQLVRSAMHADHQRRRRAAQRKGMAANPDHLAVRETALALASDHPGVRIILFEDLPYLWHEDGVAEAARVAKAHQFQLREQITRIDPAEKRGRLTHYRSQLDALDPDQRRLSSGAVPQTERYWLTTPDTP